ncbi:TetR/AcrR family transcriptional regulator [Actinomadura sp. 6N118]|uniref:TetR/AcrR family transcriptional regulator n=1 Tax=Actinomadura sp. 6N118 TaxID=3375151 RepID=UPI00379520FF
MPRAKLRTPELRDRVLQAAMAMLADEGVTAFTARKVAQGAGTSVPAVYELFGDKAGLVREIFFEGFRRLLHRLEDGAPTDDPRADLERVVQVFRGFVLDNPVLAEVMFARPFAEFDPGAEDLQAAAAVREFFVGGVRRCVAAGQMSGDPTDAAHVLLALAQGMAAQETAGWLGTSQASVDRRWGLAVHAMIDGFAPESADPSG